jgi:hypothetical protein
MKRRLLVVISIALLVLCWAALDEITTGNQPDHVWEWMCVLLTVVWFAGLGVARIVRLGKHRQG